MMLTFLSMLSIYQQLFRYNIFNELSHLTFMVTLSFSCAPYTDEKTKVLREIICSESYSQEAGCDSIQKQEALT